MKKATYILAFIFVTCASAFAQTDSGSVTGIVTQVKPHFAGTQALLVNNTELILVSDPKDASGNTFEINKEFQDLVVKGRENGFVLNPKYKGKTIKFTYTVNGKGWKCIAKAAAAKQDKNKIEHPKTSPK